jgi:hypothetical protein
MNGVNCGGRALVANAAGPAHAVEHGMVGKVAGGCLALVILNSSQGLRGDCLGCAVLNGTAAALWAALHTPWQVGAVVERLLQLMNH